MINFKGKKKKVWIHLEFQDLSAKQISWQNDIKSSSITVGPQKLVHLQTWNWDFTQGSLVPVWGWPGTSLGKQPVKSGRDRRDHGVRWQLGLCLLQDWRCQCHASRFAQVLSPLTAQHQLRAGSSSAKPGAKDGAVPELISPSSFNWTVWKQGSCCASLA